VSVAGRRASGQHDRGRRSCASERKEGRGEEGV